MKISSFEFYMVHDKNTRFRVLESGFIILPFWGLEPKDKKIGLTLTYIYSVHHWLADRITKCPPLFSEREGSDRNDNQQKGDVCYRQVQNVNIGRGSQAEQTQNKYDKSIPNQSNHCDERPHNWYKDVADFRFFNRYISGFI